MGDAPDMPQLKEDTAALGMDGVGNPAPTLDLGVAVDAGGVDVTLPFRNDLRRLGDQQSGGGALGIIFEGLTD
jgi:hypothetical protein